jgi:hypothetical protein
MSAPLRTGTAFALAAALAVTGCAAERRVPPRAPSLPSPNDGIPPDLDLVVRVDLARVRAGLGSEAVSGLRKQAALEQAGDPSEVWLGDAIERSDGAILALRPEFGPEGPDNVLVLSGRFEGLWTGARAPEGWLAPVDLGGDVRRFDRKQLGARSSPARFYAFGDRQLVILSAAEIDSVEGVLERGRAPSTLRPKASGLLSFQARLRDADRLLRSRFPLLARLLGSAVSVAGTVDISAESLVSELGLELLDPGQAGDAAAVLDGLAKDLAVVDGRLGVIAKNAKVQATGRFVGVRITLDRPALASVWPR